MLHFTTFLFLTRGKKIGKQWENKKVKIQAPAWNDEFELLDGCCSVSDIQDYLE